jgi:citrate lyase subunit beta/citryl-CoA lyase
MPFELGPAILFCPASKPERFAKASARADAVILDLEDAVGPDEKTAARRALAESGLDPARTIVRVSGADTADFASDCAAIREGGYRFVMVPKCESTAHLDAAGDFDLIPQIETPRGALCAVELAAHPRTVALFWGAEDLVRQLGGSSSRDEHGRYTAVVEHVRSTVLLAASAHGIPAIDAIFKNFADATAQRAEAKDAARSGFAATAAIHPNQVQAIREGFAPSTDEVTWAGQVLNAAAANSGAFGHDNQMIDEPVLHQARRILARQSAFVNTVAG